MQTVIINGVTIEIPDGAVASDEPNEQSTKVTKLAFRNRFTFAEKVAIETAAETDAAVRVLLKDQDAASFIDLKRKDTYDGLQILVNKNLLESQRPAEILSLSIQPEEEYRG